jgi:DNA-directed RNA polymerase specialized sigma24 family protein
VETISVKDSHQQQGWVISPRVFDALLNWLDQGTNSSGKTYLEMQRRLVSYFDRKNCSTPDELADETLNRVARRLEEEGTIESETPAKYCYIVARFVFLEYLRESHRKGIALDEARRQGPGVYFVVPEGDNDEEKRLACLRQCISKLDPVGRELVTRYYVGKARVKIANRRSLAESLGITMNALAIRACRLRDKLEACIRQCLNEAK